MANIIVVFPKIEDAKNIRILLTRHGYNVIGHCNTGAKAIQYAQSTDDGIVVCGYKFGDMMYSNLHELLPPHYEMLLVASQHMLSNCDSQGIVCLSMPIKTHELVSTLEMMVQNMERRKRKQKQKQKMRSTEDRAIIDKAKALLMERNNMTEEDAHRYIQKCSMDSGTNMVETAQMVLSIMDF